MLLPIASQYGICGVVRLAMRSQGDFCLLDDLVRGTNAPEHMVRKVFQQLGRRKILRSVRGVRGGFALGKDPRQITLMEVVEVLDGPWPDTPWGEAHLWEIGEICPLAISLQPLWERFGHYLRITYISDLIDLASDSGRLCLLGENI